MTDLLRVLPQFPVGQYANLIPVLEKHAVTTNDLLTLEAVEIGKRTQLPLLDIKRLSKAVLDTLHSDLGAGLKNTAISLAAQWRTISTLDDALDTALGGGIPTGYVTEITGESGAGKTQFLLTLLLAVQLPPPRGLGKTAMYISTEAALSTRRLAQIISANPTLRAVDADSRPSLDNIISQATPDLESQDHILTFQVPVAIERRDVGLLVLDSVAANFRAEFERSAGQGQSSSMGARSAELVRLGMQLHELATKYKISVVVANQVADRFGGASVGFKTPKPPQSTGTDHHQRFSLGNSTQSSPLATRSNPLFASATKHAANDVPASSIRDKRPNAPEDDAPLRPPPPPTFQLDEVSEPSDPALALDHQQRWFTGWGDDPNAEYALKTPSLGLVWSTQISARIALFKRPTYHYGGRGRHSLSDRDGGMDKQREQLGMPNMTTWKRWMKVVFAPHTRASGPLVDGREDGPVEFEVTMGGIRSVRKE